MPQAHDHFRMLLVTVVGGAFSAAGYALEESPTAWSGGLFRFGTQFTDGPHTGLYGFIEFMYLYYSEGRPARFNCTLIRTDHEVPTVPTRHPAAARRDLSALVVLDFGVAILPNPAYWWHVTGTEATGRALGEAGSLAIGYGMPWLNGSLLVPGHDPDA
jgi:hypothetical protein